MKVDVSSGFWRQRPVRELAILKDHLAPEGRLFLFHEPLGNTAPPPTAGPVPAPLEGTGFDVAQSLEQDLERTRVGCVAAEKGVPC
jgi:hypothetical protein